MGHVAYQIRGWVLVGGFSLHPVAVVGVAWGVISRYGSCGLINFVCLYTQAI